MLSRLRWTWATRTLVSASIADYYRAESPNMWVCMRRAAGEERLGVLGARGADTGARAVCCTRFTPVMWVGRSVRRLTIPSLRGLSAGAPRVGGCGIARHACGPRLCGALEAEFRVFSSLQQQLTEPIGGAYSRTECHTGWQPGSRSREVVESHNASRWRAGWAAVASAWH